MEEMKKEFYFKNLKNSIEFLKRLNFITNEGWIILNAKPIGKTSIKIFCSKRL